eukprot:scaffold356_cov363-Prasinococcus_capsulatus_cf.AAC.1
MARLAVPWRPRRHPSETSPGYRRAVRRQACKAAAPAADRPARAPHRAVGSLCGAPLTVGPADRCCADGMPARVRCPHCGRLERGRRCMPPGARPRPPNCAGDGRSPWPSSPPTPPRQERQGAAASRVRLGLWAPKEPSSAPARPAPTPGFDSPSGNWQGR